MKIVDKPGVFTGATIKDYGVSADKNGLPTFAVTFKFMEGENERSLSWFGSTSGGAKEITIKTLVNVLGYKGSTGEEIAGGLASNALDATKQYDITVDRSEWPLGSGTWRDKISFVNELGKGNSGKVKTLEGHEASILLKGANLGGDFMAEKSGSSKSVTQEDIPF